MCGHFERAFLPFPLSLASAARALSVFLVLIAAPVAAQNTSAPAIGRRFSIEVAGSLQGGWTWFGNALDAMRQARLDGQRCGDFGEIYCSGGAGVFLLNSDPVSVVVSAEYRLGLRISIRGLVSTTGETEAFGYYDGGPDEALTDAELQVAIQKASFYGFLVTYRPTGLVRLGAGPAFFTTGVRTLTGGGVSETQARSYVGALFDVANTFPARSAIYAIAAGQYRWTLAKDLGPIDARNEAGEVLTTMPRIAAPLSHSALMLGLGIRVR
jgi:hypothetical protein